MDVYVIYKDEHPLDSNSAGIRRNAYVRPSDAKSVVKSLVDSELYAMDIFNWKDSDKYKQEYVWHRQHYSIHVYRDSGETV